MNKKGTIMLNSMGIIKRHLLRAVCCGNAIAVAFLLQSCGSEGYQEASLKPDEPVKDVQRPATQAYKETTANAEVAFKGFVVSAFEVTVDGTRYADMEEFYSKELERLPNKVKAAGFPETSKIDFEAMIGIADLWTNMQVYISSTENRGYLGTAKVGASGDFSIKLPADANRTQYKVRAVKRINLRISNAEQSKNFCYNFSALDHAVLLSDTEKPVLLDQFETRLTAYACETDSESGVKVPAADSFNKDGPPKVKEQNIADEDKITPGSSKAAVLKLISAEKINTEGNKWCIQSFLTDYCTVNYVGACPCSLSFDENGKVNAQYNMSAKYINILHW